MRCCPVVIADSEPKQDDEAKPAATLSKLGNI
jgi:hypothetical protein